MTTAAICCLRCGQTYEAFGPVHQCARQADEGASAPYLEFIAKTHNTPEEGPAMLPDGRAAEVVCPVRCGGWAALGACDEGSLIMRQVLCGREWCPDCGQLWSDAHRRRYARWLPKLRQSATWGYFVITFPAEWREKLRDPDELRAARQYVRRLLQREGFDRGLMRWHWFGDHTEKLNDERDGDGTWHPHLNVLVPAGFLAMKVRDADGQDREGPLGRVIRLIREHFGCSNQVIHYSYGQTASKVHHLAKYATRPTFTNGEWDPAMVIALKGFRNNTWWGKWDDAPVWALEDLKPAEGVEVDERERQQLERLVGLEKGLCPCCNKPIKWQRIVNWKEVENDVVEDYGGRYFRVARQPERAERQRARRQRER